MPAQRKTPKWKLPKQELIKIFFQNHPQATPSEVAIATGANITYTKYNIRNLTKGRYGQEERKRLHDEHNHIIELCGSNPNASIPEIARLAKLPIGQVYTFIRSREETGEIPRIRRGWQYITGEQRQQIIDLLETTAMTNAQISQHVLGTPRKSFNVSYVNNKSKARLPEISYGLNHSYGLSPSMLHRIREKYQLDLKPELPLAKRAEIFRRNRSAVEEVITNNHLSAAEAEDFRKFVRKTVLQRLALFLPEIAGEHIFVTLLARRAKREYLWFRRYGIDYRTLRLTNALREEQKMAAIERNYATLSQFVRDRYSGRDWQDVTHDAVLRAWEALGMYDPQAHGSVSKFLKGIALDTINRQIHEMAEEKNGRAQLSAQANHDFRDALPRPKPHNSL
ncbi:Uncharacterised protein [uncultured archaeon]|nr:Uncharacterised protein [uncultured archaeon]